MDEDLPEVLTATRLRQSKARTPGTVTVLEGEMLRDLGVVNLWEAFRLVPGMTVGMVGSYDPVVTYHGTVATEQRRLQVKVDGRSHYNPSLADVNWIALPVPLEDIERIEVTRGPNAAAYGANSFLAVINIITKSPQDTHGAQVRAIGGTEMGFQHYYGALGARSGNTDWRLSLNYRETDGHDFDRDGNEFPDGHHVSQVNYSSVTELDPQNDLTIRGGALRLTDYESIREYEGFNPQSTPDETGNDFYGQIRWDHQASPTRFFHFDAYMQRRDRKRGWRSEFQESDLLGLEIIQAGIDAQGVEGYTLNFPDNPFSAHVNEDLKEDRYQLEFQQTHLLGDQDQLMYGASYRYERFDSDTFFGGTKDAELLQAFANLDFALTPWLIANVGAMYEEDSEAGDFVSPRAALNWQITPSQALRFVISRAYRTPDPFEQSADWGYRASNFRYLDEGNGDFEGERLIQFQAPGNLEAERILSREISYFNQTRVGDAVFSGEVKVFRNSVDKLISGRQNIIGSPQFETVEVDGEEEEQLIGIRTWDLENNVSATQKGAELELEARWPRNQLRGTYAYFRQDGRYTGSQVDDPDEQFFFIRSERRMAARHTGSASWIHRFPANVTGAISYYHMDNLRDNKFERIDLRLARSLYFGDFSMEVAALWQHYLNDDPLYRADNNRERRNHLFGELRLRF